MGTKCLLCGVSTGLTGSTGSYYLLTDLAITLSDPTVHCHFVAPSTSRSGAASKHLFRGATQVPPASVRTSGSNSADDSSIAPVSVASQEQHEESKSVELNEQAEHTNAASGEEFPDSDSNGPHAKPNFSLQ